MPSQSNDVSWEELIFGMDAEGPLYDDEGNELENHPNQRRRVPNPDDDWYDGAGNETPAHPNNLGKNLPVAKFAPEEWYDEDGNETAAHPNKLPVAKFAPKIPEGGPVAFVDKNRRFTGQNAHLNPDIQRDEDRWFRVGDWTSGTVTGVDEVAAPVDAWVAFASTWISMAQWKPDNEETTEGSLYVKFLSNAVVRYNNVPAMLWTSMIRSKSKGRFVYWTLAFPNGRDPVTKRAINGWPYELLAYPTRIVTKEMQKKNFERTFADGMDFDPANRPAIPVNLPPWDRP